MLPCSRLIDSERSAARVNTRLSVTWFAHLTISDTARRAPAASPALRNSAILSCFSLPEMAFLTVSVCGSSGRLATLSRSSRNGSVSYTHLRAHETPEHLVCRLLLEKKKSDEPIHLFALH